MTSAPVDQPPAYEASEQEPDARVPGASRPQLASLDEETGKLTLDGDGHESTAQFKDGRLDIDISKVDTKLRVQHEELQQQAVNQKHDSAQRVLSKSTVIPPLNIVIQVVGSRGDVQPFIALGLELKNRYGHRIRLATHGTFKKFVEENRLEFFDIGGNPQELMDFMVKNPGLIPGMKSIREGDIGKRKKGMAETMLGCWKSCADHTEGDEQSDESDSSSAEYRKKIKPFVANAIIANPPSFAHIHLAERMGIPLHLMFTMPWSPTAEFTQPLANIKSSGTTEGSTNLLSYTIVEIMTWEGLGSLTNKFRNETLHLNEISQQSATTAITRLKIPYTYCWSPALIPKPKDWGPHIDIAGFYFLPLGTNYHPDPDLAAFLAAGPPPVYIGFGSIVVDDPNSMTKLIFEAVQKTGQRALVSKGWGGLGGDELGKPKDIFMLGNCPHDWLFQRVSAVVHHGGAGTTAAGIAAGKPTVIVPFFGDQPFWGAMVARAGAGPTPVPYKNLTADKLAEAITFALQPDTLTRAQELGHRIQNEDGAKAGAESFHAQLDLDRMRCSLCPDRVAVWQVVIPPKAKSSSFFNSDDNHPTLGPRLSAFAAQVLSNHGLLDMNALELYRPYQYDVEDFGGIFSGDGSGASRAVSTAGTIANRVVRWPVRRAKAWGGLVAEPYKGARNDGWRGLGKGLGKGIGNWLFPKRGVVLGTYRYTARGLYEHLRKGNASEHLSFILATHIMQGFEDVRVASEEECVEVVRRWEELPEEMRPDVQGPAEVKPDVLEKVRSGDIERKKSGHADLGRERSR